MFGSVQVIYPILMLVSFLKNTFACCSARAPHARTFSFYVRTAVRTLKKGTYIAFGLASLSFFLRWEGTENVNSKVFLWKLWIVDLHKHKIDQHLIISFSKKALLNQHKAKFTEV